MRSTVKLLHTFMIATGFCLGGAVLAGGAHAQQGAWPQRPIKIMVPVAPGGATDATARLLQQSLADTLGQPIVIENKPGGGGVIATDSVAKATDGHTFGIVNIPHAANVALRPNLPYNTIADFKALAFMWRAPAAISVHPSVASRTIPELIAASKTKTMSYGTPGVGFAMHLAGELFRTRSGADIVHVAYRGAGPALNDAIGGHIPLVITNVASSAPLIDSGQLVGIAVTGPTRSPLLPKVPTVAEQGFPGYEITEWLIAIAPKNTPPEHVQRLNAAINKAIANPEIAAKFQTLGLEPKVMTAAETDAFVASEIDKLSKIVRDANIKAE